MTGKRKIDELSNLLAEKKRRDNEALRLYRPLPGQQEAFLKGLAPKRIARGGNRSGKSTVCSIEMAHAITGIPIYDSQGNQIPDKYPRKEPMTMWVVGLDLGHVARNVHRLLFEKGAFKVIKDLHTGLPRAFNPQDPADMEREAEAYRSDPLVPDRFIKEFAWENKAQRVFNSVRFTNGNILHAFSSKGEEPQGDQIDLVWVDEDVANPELIRECQMRLIDRKGRFIWSAYPKVKNISLRSMSKEAQEADPRNPSCQEFVLRLSDNPFMDAEFKESILAGLTDDQRRSRDYGHFQTDLVSMFPGFEEHIHCVPLPDPDNHDAIDRAIINNGMHPPGHWTRYLVLDPGHARPAVLLAAVPPPELESEKRSQSTIVCYDEIAIPRLSASELAPIVQQRINSEQFEVFIIDDHAGRQHSMGRGDTVEQNYAKEFEKLGIKSRLSKSHFCPGSDDVAGGCEMIRNRLTPRWDGRGSIRIIKEKCPNLVNQMIDYRKGMDARGYIDDKPAPRQIDDLVDCLRYLVAFGPTYRRPDRIETNDSGAYQRFLKDKELKKQKEQWRRGNAVYLGIVSGGAG